MVTVVAALSREQRGNPMIASGKMLGGSILVVRQNDPASCLKACVWVLPTMSVGLWQSSCLSFAAFGRVIIVIAWAFEEPMQLGFLFIRHEIKAANK